MKKEKLYSGSTKTVYSQESQNTIIMSFEDNIWLEKNKTIQVSGKGSICNQISAFLMEKLNLVGINNHFIKKNNMKQQIVQLADMIPVQLRVTNVACGRYVKDFGLEEGFVFESPILDFRIKSCELGFPIINEFQMKSYGWVSDEELIELKKTALRINDFLTGIFSGSGIRLVESNLEFGRVFVEEDFYITLADEISPDTCRLWDLETNKKLSYELAYTNPEEINKSYNEIAKRICAGPVSN